jgi:hypothetical protein
MRAARPLRMPPLAEVVGQRAFQVRDPNGIIIEFLDWSA